MFEHFVDYATVRLKVPTICLNLSFCNEITYEGLYKVKKHEIFDSNIHKRQEKQSQSLEKMLIICIINLKSIWKPFNDVLY